MTVPRSKAATSAFLTLCLITTIAIGTISCSALGIGATPTRPSAESLLSDATDAYRSIKSAILTFDVRLTTREDKVQLDVVEPDRTRMVRNDLCVGNQESELLTIGNDSYFRCGNDNYQRTGISLGNPDNTTEILRGTTPKGFVSTLSMDSADLWEVSGLYSGDLYFTARVPPKFNKSSGEITWLIGRSTNLPRRMTFAGRNSYYGDFEITVDFLEYNGNLSITKPAQ
jgi:hypothetical protein